MQISRICSYLICMLYSCFFFCYCSPLASSVLPLPSVWCSCFFVASHWEVCIRLAPHFVLFCFLYLFCCFYFRFSVCLLPSSCCFALRFIAFPLYISLASVSPSLSLSFALQMSRCCRFPIVILIILALICAALLSLSLYIFLSLYSVSVFIVG